MELISDSHSIGQNLYHLEWCPKYRYKMFRREENKNLNGRVRKLEVEIKKTEKKYQKAMNIAERTLAELKGR